MELLFKITDNINTVNERKSKKMEKIFSSKKPIVTNAIIVLCIMMFIISGFGFDTYTLVKYGANSSILVKGGEYYRLFSYMFLHAGFIHILLNMYSKLGSFSSIKFNFLLFNSSTTIFSVNTVFSPTTATLPPVIASI